MAFIVWASRPTSSSTGDPPHPVVEGGGVGDGRHLGADELDGPQRPPDEEPHQEAGQERTPGPP